MTGKSAKAAVRYENPLMPDERLRQMYTAMAQVRMLEESLAGKRGGKQDGELAVIRGEEAARAATALSLGAGDLLSDCLESAGMYLLLGAPLRAVREGARLGKPAKLDSPVLRLPTVEDGEDRLQMSLGAAAALRAQGGGRVVLVYARPGEIGTKQWKRAMHGASRGELPMLVVLLPDVEEEAPKRAGEMARRSRRWGVPGFPVDGTDAIAMYRVMQESLLRARAGEGPALVESIRFAVHGVKSMGPEDPVERLGELMLAKGAATPEWMERTRRSFAERLRRPAERRRARS